MKPIIAAPSVFTALAEELRATSHSSSGDGASKLPKPLSNVVSFKIPVWAINGRPAAAFADLRVESLSAGRVEMWRGGFR